jgi:hypothetical protein
MWKKTLASLLLALTAAACGAHAHVGGAHAGFCIGGSSCP